MVLRRTRPRGEPRPHVRSLCVVGFRLAPGNLPPRALAPRENRRGHRRRRRRGRVGVSRREDAPVSRLQRRWTAEERERLRALVLSGQFDRASAAQLLEAFPGRTLPGLRAAARRCRPASWSRSRKFSPHRAWTVGEIKLLQELWPNASERSLRDRLRGRSWHAIQLRAWKLGLSPVRWQGFETVSAAAERAGFSESQLLKILRAWHAHFQTLSLAERDSLPCPTLRAKRTRTSDGRRVRLVESGTVELAVAHWHELETLTDARRRTGVREWSRPGLARALGLRREDRLTPEAWDAILRLHGSGRRRIA